MKVAVVTDDNKTVSAHFGRAEYFLVYEAKDGAIVKRESRPKASHQHRDVMQIGREAGAQQSEANFHDTVLSSVRDCEAVITGGMGYGMYASMMQAHIKPFVTDVSLADVAVQQYLKGTLANHLERLH